MYLKIWTLACHESAQSLKVNVVLIHTAVQSSHSGLQFGLPSLCLPYPPIPCTFYCSLKKVNKNPKYDFDLYFCRHQPRALSFRWNCCEVGPLRMERKLVVRHLSPTVTLYGVTNTHTLGQYRVNKPTFDWQVTFHYGGIAEAQSKSKQTRPTQCHSQDTPQRQTGRQDRENLLQDFRLKLQTFHCHFDSI